MLNVCDKFHDCDDICCDNAEIYYDGGDDVIFHQTRHLAVVLVHLQLLQIAFCLFLCMGWMIHLEYLQMHHPWAAFQQVVVGSVFVFVSLHFFEQGGGRP